MGIWEEYRKKKRHLIKLDEIELPGLWIEVLKTSALTLAELGEIEKIKDNPTVEDTINFLSRLIVNWNIPGEDGSLLPLPAKDRDALRQLPIEVVTFVNQRIAQLEGASPLSIPQRVTS